MHHLIFFIDSNAGDSGYRFVEAVRQRFATVSSEVFQTLRDLETWLRNKEAGIFGMRIIVLFADTRSCLDRLEASADLMDGEQVILLLPDSEKTTLEKAQRLRPRYFGFSSGPFDDVCDVITKMLRR
ncbi:MAG: hypothetical protein MI802_28195 [Desulfobacterales bacterium]|nr:hypothetical protein [Desulfobacterales bacterium]